jgi:Ca2+-binding EF-hand superfamily protein
MKKLQVGLIAIGILAAIQVNAQEMKKPKQTPEQRFAKMDANGDRVLTLDEMKKGKGDEGKEAEVRFKKWDANADGRVTKEEFVAKKEIKEAMKKEKHEKMERRENSPKLSPEQHFAKIDANGDQTITFDEMKKGPDAKEAEEHFKKMDTNGDGRITKEEFLAKKELHNGKPKMRTTPAKRN